MEKPQNIEFVRVTPEDTDLYQQVNAVREVYVTEQNEKPEIICLDDDLTSIYLLSVDGRAVATGRIKATEEGFKLERIATTKEVRGKGFGRELLLRLHQVCRANDASKKIYLESDITAVGFYLKLGYQKDGEPFNMDIWESLQQKMHLVL